MPLHLHFNWSCLTPRCVHAYVTATLTTQLMLQLPLCPYKLASTLFIQMRVADILFSVHHPKSHNTF